MSDHTLAMIVADLSFFIAQQAHASQQYELAEYWYNHSLRLQPNNPDIHQAMTYVLGLQRKYPQAINSATFAMRGRDPVTMQYTRALLHLMNGNYKTGFKDYQIRLDLPQNKKPRLERFGSMKYWEGEKCNKLWVAGEQGFGDIFMFSRYVLLIKEKFQVDKIIFEVPAACQELFAYNLRQRDDIEVVTNLIKPEADYYVQLASMPHIFGTTIDQVPPIFIEAQPDYISKFIKATPTGSMKIGFVCQGRDDADDLMAQEWNSRRNIDLKFFKDMWPEKHVKAFLDPRFNSEIKTWSDTAGVIANQDVIISVDSGPVHLAAAMGKPVFLLNNKQTCWRWGLDGEQSPWYNNNLRVFRQEHEGVWEPVIAKVGQALRAL